MSTQKSSLGIILILLVPVITIAAYLIHSYNGILTAEEEVLTAWSQVESNYQRRADLVPNLVKTVQAYAGHEKSLITDVTDARAKALQSLTGAAQELTDATATAGSLTSGSKEKLSDETHMAAVAGAQKDVNSRITALMAMTEAYPNLKASDNFLALQDQLEGTENRINIARMTFNERAGEFNASIRRIPGTLVASWGGFKRKAYFQSDAEASKAPALQFEK